MTNQTILATITQGFGRSLHALADNYDNLGVAIGQWTGMSSAARPAAAPTGVRGPRRRTSRPRNRTSGSARPAATAR
jgi:hypothetical protein